MSFRYGLWGLLAVFVVASLSGCVHPPPPRTTVNVLGDKFTKTITLEGIPQNDPNNGDGLFWMLRSIVDPQTRITQQQIYVEWTYPGPFSGRYFAADDTARPLPVDLIRKESCPFGRCDRIDILAIGIDEGTLRLRASTGFQVKLSAQGGTAGILSFTPQMINAQLVAEDNVLGGATPVVAQATASSGAASASTPPTPGGPTLGISYMQVSASRVNSTFPDGLFIIVVTPNSPAAKSGIKTGDILISFDGKPLPDPASAKGVIDSVKPGSIVTAEIQRGVDRMKLDVHM